MWRRVCFSHKDREKCKFSSLSKQISFWMYTGNNLGVTLYLKTKHTFLLYFCVAFHCWESIIQHICLCLLPVNTGVIWSGNRGMALKELLLEGKHVCLLFQTKYICLWRFFKLIPCTGLLCPWKQNNYSQYVGIDGIIANLLGTGKMFIKKDVVMYEKENENTNSMS